LTKKVKCKGDFLSNTIPVGAKYGFRKDTRAKVWPINFVFNDGGMGDFVNYSVATVWMAKNAPWVQAKLFVPRYLVELMQIIHSEFRRWTVLPSEEVKQHLEKGSAIIGPSITINGQRIAQQLLTVIGAHPIEVGFAYYAEQAPAPKDALLPVLDFEKPDYLPTKYVVIPCGFSAESRALAGKELNPIIDHIVSCGITPVFLGKSDLLLDGKRTTKFNEDINFHLGVDLRDKTTVVEAASIMQHAVCTVGLDMGLLHLAALMKDSKIIFGYNITTPEHRRPRRDHGKTVDIFLTRDELECVACQSTLKKLPEHTFDKCYYGDNKCVELLFANNSDRWIKAIDEVRNDHS